MDWRLDALGRTFSEELGVLLLLPVFKLRMDGLTYELQSNDLGPRCVPVVLAVTGEALVNPRDTLPRSSTIGVLVAPRFEVPRIPESSDFTLRMPFSPP